MLITCKFLCQIKKPWARWFDFDRSFVYTQISYDMKPLRKMFTWISSEMTLPQHFVQKFPFSYFWKSFQCFFLKRYYIFMQLNLSNLHTAVLILSTKEFVSSWLTNVHSWRLNEWWFRKRSTWKWRPKHEAPKYYPKN